MLQRYKEIDLGFLLGMGAWAIDVIMHAQMEGRSLWTELVRPQAAMLFYRVLFPAFALALGWSLWQKSKRERDFRRLAEILERFHHEIVGPAFLIHGKGELLLTRKDFHLSPAAQESLRFIYEKSQRIESVAKERLPLVTEK